MRSPFPKLSASALVIVLVACTLSSVVGVTDRASARIDSNGLSYNGNQELAADPARSVIYHGDGGNLHVWDYIADTTASVPLGGTTVRSVDLSPDGSRVAVAVDDFIAIVNVAAQPVLEATNETSYGNIVSVRYLDADTLVMSFESSPSIATIDLLTGIVSTPVDAGIFPALEVSDDGSTVLAFAIGSAANTVVKRYSYSAGSLAYQSESVPLGGFFSQASVDWAAERIYLACSEPSAVQVLNLGDLGVATTLPLEGSSSGVTRSLDGRIVYGVATAGQYPSGSSVLFAFDASSGAALSRRYLSYTAGPIAPTADPWTVVTASPLALEAAGPVVEGTAPEDGQRFAYTPSHVQFTVANDPAVGAEDIALTIDGVTYPPSAIASNTFQVDLAAPLSPGEHVVNTTVSWAGYGVPGGWKFASGSTDERALAPSLTMLAPLPGSTGNTTPGQFVVRLTTPRPPPLSPNVTVTVNGIVLPAVQDAVNTSDYAATLPTGLDLTGTNTVVGSVIVEGRSFNTSWGFTVFPDPEPETDFVMVDYGDNFRIPAPANWTVQRDNGEQELVLTGPSHGGVATVVSVDIVSDTAVRSDYEYIGTYTQNVLQGLNSSGHPSEMVGPVNDTAISNLTAGVWKLRWTDGGQQEAYALIVDDVKDVRWLVRCVSSDASFIDLWPVFERMISGIEIDGSDSVGEVPPPVQGYAYYRLLDDYQLMVPDNWTIRREGPAGMYNASMWAVGPEADGLKVDIILQAGTDRSLAAAGDGLPAVVDDIFIPELASQGIDATVYREPQMTNISGLPALTFSLRLGGLLPDSSVIRDVFLIVDGERYWLITCSASEGAHPTYRPVFETVAESFTVLSASSPSPVGMGLFTGPGAWVLVGTLGAVAVAAVGALFAIFRIRRRRAT